MKKRILSLLCVLALCLGLLPTTALAAGEDAPDKLYVGNQQVIVAGTVTYWTTDDSGGLTRVDDATDDSNNWNVKYDPISTTLTLNEAKISGIYDEYNNPYNAGIYAKGSSNQSVALTIELIGTNTITGSYGIYLDGHRGNTICTNASVLIKNGNESGESGSLTVNGTGSHGIYILSGTGNASLTIENASVVANATSLYSGVRVQSGASSKDSPVLSLTVNGGSLTTSGSASDEGIKFYVGANGATSATTSLTVTDNAIVDARTGGISASGVSVNPNVDIGSTGSTGGIVFDGTEGTVYGDVTLDEPLTVGESETLTIPEGATLNGNSNLTNNGTVTIENGGALTGGDAINNGGTINVENGGNLEGTPAGGGTVVYKVSSVTLAPAELSLFTGESQPLTAKVEPADATNQDVTWSSNNTAVATVDENGTVTAKGAGEATITVTTQDGGKQATCKVKVTDPVYNITTDPTALDFGKAYTGYAQPAAKTVTVTNNGNQQVTVTLPTAKNFVITAGDGFVNGSATITPGNTATFTVQPKADLAAGNHKESINISGQSGSNPVSASVDATFAVVDINSTNVDNKLTITSGISAGIPNTAFDTAEEVKSELTRVLVQDAAYTAGNTAFYDVKLQYSLDGGQTWFEATEATFPTEGITVTLPYPSGTGKDTHNFRVVHMFTVTSTRLGTEAGKTEIPAVTKTDSGLQVTLKGLSPVVIGWDKIETPSSGGSTTPAATATPAPSDNITYYTCPSCGYHNWTATDAGYRCDHCGYLESTKQLSVYGNVKGTYTPGSNSAAAVSTVPQTGDKSNPVLWTVLLLVSGLALGSLAIARRKKQQ